jgi:hypothetical protein
VFVVLDALDEGQQIVQDNLVPKVLTLPFQDIRLICMSRPLPQFKQLFDGTETIAITANEDDLSLFINKRIEKSQRLKLHIKKAPSLEKDIVDKVIKMADKMWVTSYLKIILVDNDRFLLARLHVDSLEAETSIAGVKDALIKLPSGIVETYNLAIQRIRNQKSTEATMAICVLTCVAYAEGPLSIREMQHLLATISLPDDKNSISEEDLPYEEVILSICSDFLVGDWFLFPIHQTVQEFFDEHRSTALPGGDALLATACVRYLNLRNVHSAARLPFSEEIKDDIGPSEGYQWLEEKLREKVPFAFYAGDNWEQHFSKTDRSEEWEKRPGFGMFWMMDRPWNAFELGRMDDDVSLDQGEDSDGTEDSSRSRVEITLRFKRRLPSFVLHAYRSLPFALYHFLEFGGDINEPDCNGKSILDHALHANHSEALFYLLINKGRRPDGCPSGRGRPRAPGPNFPEAII